MRLRTASSPHRLERALLEAVAEARAERPRGLVALVVPTRVLADRVQAALLDEAGAAGVVAGVQVLHHRALAERVLELAWLHGLSDRPPPRVASALELDQLLRQALTLLPRTSPLRSLAFDRPRVVASLMRTLTELREALVEPEDLRGAGADDDLCLALAAWSKLLERLERDHGVTDSAGHARAATAAASALGSKLPWTQVLHHAAHELVAVHARLLGAIAESVPLLVTATSGAGPAHVASRVALARWLGADAAASAGHVGRGSLLDVEALFDDGSSPALPPFGAVTALHVRGAVAELDAAARLVLAAHVERGVPLEDLAILARTLEPYAGHLDAVLGSHGLPHRTSAAAPLRREPWAHAFRLLIQVLDEDLPRGPLVELLRSAWTRLDAGGVAAGDAEPDLWDTWTRRARVVRGAASYQEDMTSWHETDLRNKEVRHGKPIDRTEAWVVDRARRIEALGTIARALDRDRQAWIDCASPGERAAFTKDLASRWLRDPPPGSSAARARGAVLSAIEELERVDVVRAAAAAAGCAAPPRDDPRELLEQALASCTLPIGEPGGGGVRVLSVMQARGVPFREAVLVGFNQGIVPRRPRPDPFLDEGARERLRDAGLAIQPRSAARDEERLLLAVLLSAASERVTVTWQRAAEDGRAKTPSLHLRELARIAMGKPDLSALTERSKDADAAERVPVVEISAHPSGAARQWRSKTGRATWRDAVLEAADRPQRVRALRRLAELTARASDELTSGLDKVHVVDAFELARLEHPDEALLHDGILGPGVVQAPTSLSATSLETFGTCALRWLFKEGLRIEELDEPAEELDLEASDLGSFVHEVLEEVYLDVIVRDGSGRAVADSRTTALLERTWAERFVSFVGTRRERAPVYWDALSARWLASARRFVERDAERLTKTSSVVRFVEIALRERVLFAACGRAVEMGVHGRLDRVVETPTGWRIEDYKTSRSFDKNAKTARVLKGLQLQGVAYLLAGREWARRTPHSRTDDAVVEVAFLPLHPDVVEEEPAVLGLDGATLESALETLAVLDELLHGGRFPLSKGDACAWCAYRESCRQGHVPTMERLGGVDELRDYARIRLKHTRNTRISLADLRGAEDDD